jgi:hypothetical protein
VVQRVNHYVDGRSILPLHRLVQVFQQYMDVEIRRRNQLHEVNDKLFLRVLRLSRLLIQMLSPRLQLLVLH